MVERYRDLQRPSMLETGIVDQSSARTMQQLADTFKSFEEKANNGVSLLRTQQGQEEGAQQGATGDPQLRKGLRSLTAYGRAYNNAATRSYLISAEADANDTATRLEGEAGTDPEKFRATFGKVREEILKSSDPALRGALDEMFTQRMSSGYQRIEMARQAEVKSEQRATTAEGITRAVDAIGRLRASDDEESFFRAEEEEAKLGLLIDGAVADGTLSVTEGAALKVDAARAVVKQTVVSRFVRELDNPYGDPIGFIEKLREANKTAEALPPDEEVKLQDSLLAELRERNSLRSAKMTAENNARSLRYLEGDRSATASLLSGRLTQRQLLQMVEADRLDPADARTLLNELQAGDPGNSDPRELFSVETNLLETPEEDIRANASLSWADRSRLIQKRREEAAGWKGTQQAQEGANRIDRALGLAPNTMRAALSEEEARQRDTALTEWYNLVEALPPEERQSKAIELAEQVNSRVIKSNARDEADRVRSRLQRMKATYGSQSLSKRKQEEYDKEVARLDARLKELEAKSK
jgi:hypothetical protein